MTLPKGGSKLPLILGLILGLTAAVLAVVYLTSAKDESGGSGSSSGGGGVPVVVAAVPIPAGTRLTPEMLKITNIPESDRLLGAFSTPEGVSAQVTRVPLLANEQVVESKIGSGVTFAEGGNPPLSFVIDPGMRAVSVEVSSLIGAGGNIRPGDKVDVILIVEVKPEGADPEATGTSDQISATILQNVKVLAIDQEVTNPNAESSSDPDQAKDTKESATSLTLAVTPTQGEVLAMADVCGDNHGGRLSLSLRGAGDEAKLGNRTEWANDGPPPSCAEVLGISALGE
ncbi:MAG TPA: Flp pilus assembly protein CpaB [Dehalococcoidia bacterium]|nr:Flp pilus assembly protein CpaB [Dehalococcoidia bacterium]